MRSVASTAAFSTPPPAAFSTPPPTAFSASPPRGLLRASTPGLLRVLWADPVSARDVAYPSYCQKIAKNYRKERWSAILADVLDMSLECARQLKRIDDEILFSLELITEGPPGPHTLAKMNGAGSRTGHSRSGGRRAAVAAPLERRKAIQANVTQIIQVRASSQFAHSFARPLPGRATLTVRRMYACAPHQMRVPPPTEPAAAAAGLAIDMDQLNAFGTTLPHTRVSLYTRPTLALIPP